MTEESTTIVSYRDTPPPMVDYQSRAVERLTEWAHSAQAAHTIAESLVRTSFVPAAFRGKADEATAAILAGLEVGLQPMAALKSFDVIQGQAAPRALALRAIVQSYGHEMVLLESTATRCRMKGLRRGSSEWQTVTWTIDRARDLNLTGKDNWKKQPGAMLVARATGELARLIAADAILGLGYTAEEVADGGPVDATTLVPLDAAEAPSGARRMIRRPLLRPEPSPPLDEPTTPILDDVEPPAAPAESEPVTSEPHSAGITAPQLRKMGALMREAALNDRTAALQFVYETIGREVQSRNDLTKTEASIVIDSLEALTNAFTDAGTDDAGWAGEGQ